MQDLTETLPPTISRVFICKNAPINSPLTPKPRARHKARTARAPAVSHRPPTPTPRGPRRRRLAVHGAPGLKILNLPRGIESWNGSSSKAPQSFSILHRTPHASQWTHDTGAWRAWRRRRPWEEREQTDGQQPGSVQRRMATRVAWLLACLEPPCQAITACSVRVSN